jgi:putative RNA 2'-phosphotransferase
MNEKDTKHFSKLLSLILRHKPELAQLQLGPGGWVNIDDLLAGLETMNKPLTREALNHIVETNDKKRFTVSEDQTQIRAAQGHSVKIKDDLSPSMPPDTLYHGTAQHKLSSIMREGLKPMKRRHVHLSQDPETARRVGLRHGKPLIFQLNTKVMIENEQLFYQADNGVWLTGPVSPDYLSKISDEP